MSEFLFIVLHIMFHYLTEESGHKSPVIGTKFPLTKVSGTGCRVPRTDGLVFTRHSSFM
jgi:hypothetical protein